MGAVEEENFKGIKVKIAGMRKLLIRVGVSKDFYGAYAVDYDGIWGSGKTVAECKESIMQSIFLIKSELPVEQCPDILKDEYEIVWQYDVQSLLQYYSKYFTNTALQRMTGIHHKQLWNYLHGVSVPRAAAKQKIEDAFHKLGAELMSIKL